MSKYLVIDTETTGLFDFSKPADADGQPRLCHFVGLMLDDLDRASRNPIIFDHPIKPDGWSMSDPAAAEAAKVNGLTDEFLSEFGLPIIEVLEGYARLIDSGYIVVAFNAQYDTKVMRAELRRAGMDDRFTTTANICVQRASQTFFKAQGVEGGGKRRSLTATLELMDIKSGDAHSALGDAFGALHVLRHLHQHNALPEPAVKFAKNRPAPVGETA